MKKKLFALAVAAAMCLPLAACSGGNNPGAASTPSQPAQTESQAPSSTAPIGGADGPTDIDVTDSDLEYIKSNGKMIIGYTVYEPMNYTDENGDFTGFDTELARAVCEKLGVEPEFIVINWDTKEVALEAGDIDCIWNGFTINGREDDYTWSDPYLNNEQVMVVTSDSGIETLADLAGKNVVVQAASAALDALNSEDNKELTDSFASLTENPDYNTAFMNIDSGAADAVAVDIGVAKYQLSKREEGKYVILDEPIQSEEYGIGFKKGNDELKDTVWEEVLKLYDAGEVDKLAEKYEVADMLCIGDDEKSDDKKDDAAEDDASDADTAKEDTADTAKDAE